VCAAQAAAQAAREAADAVSHKCDDLAQQLRASGDQHRAALVAATDAQARAQQELQGLREELQVVNVFHSSPYSRFLPPPPFHA
jgi:hypothetical protein